MSARPVLKHGPNTASRKTGVNAPRKPGQLVSLTEFGIPKTVFLLHSCLPYFLDDPLVIELAEDARFADEEFHPLVPKQSLGTS